MKAEIKVHRNKESGEWFCDLVNGEKSVNLYAGKNSNTAHDKADDVAPVLFDGKDLKAGYTRLKDEKGEVNWITTIAAGGMLACLMQFGKGGANAAADFAEKVNAILSSEGGK